MQNYATKYTGPYVTIYFRNNLNTIHRLDGPAIEWRDGYKEWWINDYIYNEQDFNKHPEVLKYKMLQEAKTLLGIKNE